MTDQEPNGPPRVEPLAEEILDALRKFPESAEIVLGGYFALKEYVDYRTTHDLDAWWATGRTEGAMARIRQVMKEVAARHSLTCAEREWGETVSFELAADEDERKVFSFQIAVRSVQLEPARRSPWDPILIESLADNVGSKMSALVERGAPRDFLDIREVVRRGIATTEECWEWWSRKNPGVDADQARAQALRHLEALEQRRPIDTIDDPGDRAEARDARAWIRRTLLGLPADPDDGM